jgi:hypothetical protein
VICVGLDEGAWSDVLHCIETLFLASNHAIECEFAGDFFFCIFLMCETLYTFFSLSLSFSTSKINKRFMYKGACK